MPDANPPAPSPTAAVDASELPGQVGILTLAPGARRPEHQSSRPVVLEVLSGGGRLLTSSWGERLLVTGDEVQLPAEERHALEAGADGLVLRVRRTAPCCEGC
ncbi:MAG: cupin domain-containing protein [Gemmatimonadales bacterium]